MKGYYEDMVEYAKNINLIVIKKTVESYEKAILATIEGKNLTIKLNNISNEVKKDVLSKRIVEFRDKFGPYAESLKYIDILINNYYGQIYSFLIIQLIVKIYKCSVIDTDSNMVAFLKKKVQNKKLPKILRNIVWDTYIGKTAGIGKCYVCERQIDSKDFECGHVIAKSKGGADTVENLRPLCALCNKSMSTKNLFEFKTQYFTKV